MPPTLINVDVTLDEAQEALSKVIAYLEADPSHYENELKILTRILQDLCKLVIEEETDDNQDTEPAHHEELYEEDHHKQTEPHEQLCNEEQVHESTSEQLSDAEQQILTLTEDAVEQSEPRRSETVQGLLTSQGKRTRRDVNLKRGIATQIHPVDETLPGNQRTEYTEPKNENQGQNERPHSCDVCDKCFRNKRDLRRHVRVHTGERPYKCTVCEKSFADRSTRNYHLRIHSGEKPYLCHTVQLA